MTYTIEPVKPGDEHALAYIQTESWKAAFVNIIPAEALTQCTRLEPAVSMYRRLLENNIGHGYLLKVDGQPHCIAWWAAARDEDMAGYAELICIHSLESHWRQGYGSRMMDAVLRDAAAAGYEKILLWVFEANTRARKFYEAQGFSPTEKRKVSFGAAEMCYEKQL